MESKWSISLLCKYWMDSGFQAGDFGFDVTVTTWLQIPTVSGIPDSLSWILDFQSPKFWIPQAKICRSRLPYIGRYVYLTNYSHVYSTSAAGTRASLSFFFFQSWPVKLLALLTKRFIVRQHRSTDFICGRILRHGFLARNSILQTGAILRSHKFPLRRQFHNTV